MTFLAKEKKPREKKEFKRAKFSIWDEWIYQAEEKAHRRTRNGRGVSWGCGSLVKKCG